MTVRPQDLTESARRLFEDFRSVGLSEADAVAAATDLQSADAVNRVEVARSFSRLSEADRRAAMLRIGRSAAERTKASGEMTEAQFRAGLDRIFTTGA